MADFLLNHTGAQINTAISSVITANNNGGIVNADTLNNFSTILFPVGSIYVMSINSNPSSFLGGTWELIDKEFRSQTLTITPTRNTTNCTSAEASGHLSGHNIYINVKFTNKVAITDSTLHMFTISPSSCGVDAFYLHYLTHFTDGGNSVILSELTEDGKWNTYDVIKRGSDTASLAAATNISNIMIDMDSMYTHMLDTFCDKFYFKRTA